MYDSGECIIFPSKKMRDWSKFAWKRGDVLTNSSGFKVFFDKWVNEDYTKFLGEIKVLGDSHYYYYDTAYYILASKKEALEFIKSVEEINNGKPNLEISKIEKAQPKFKDGDILSCDEDTYTRHTTLILHKDENITESIVSLIRHRKLIKINVPIDNFLLSRLYHAKEDEKKELFDIYFTHIYPPYYCSSNISSLSISHSIDALCVLSTLIATKCRQPKQS